jgi:hypothetical protein
MDSMQASAAYSRVPTVAAAGSFVVLGVFAVVQLVQGDRDGFTDMLFHAEVLPTLVPPR